MERSRRLAYSAGMTMRMLCAALLGVCLLLSLSLMPGWIRAQTDHGLSRGLWDLSLPGIDIGLDAVPATVERPGYLQLWCYPHGADDVRNLLRIQGAPALPAPSGRPVPRRAPRLPSGPSAAAPALRHTPTL